MVAALQGHHSRFPKKLLLHLQRLGLDLTPRPQDLTGGRKNARPRTAASLPTLHDRVAHFFIAIPHIRGIFNHFSRMKPEIHPNYNETVILCACGAAYRTRSTRENIKIGICAACHPFFTGEQKFVDTAGRVDKFKRRYGTVRAPRLAKLKKTA